jgi:hypothetical protein
MGGINQPGKLSLGLVDIDRSHDREREVHHG